MYKSQQEQTLQQNSADKRIGSTTAMIPLELPQGNEAQVVLVAPGACFKIMFSPQETQLLHDGDDLIFSNSEGGVSYAYRFF